MRRNLTIFKIITVTVAIKCVGHFNAFLPTCISPRATAGANLNNWCCAFAGSHCLPFPPSKEIWFVFLENSPLL